MLFTSNNRKNPNISSIPKSSSRNLTMMRFTQNNFVSNPIVSARQAPSPPAPKPDFASLTKEIDNNLETIKNAEKQEKKEQEEEKKRLQQQAKKPAQRAVQVPQPPVKRRPRKGCGCRGGR